MSRIITAIAILLLTSAVWAQDFGGLARIDAAKSRITDAGRHAAEIDLHLSQGVPYRLFLLTEPPRIVLDFKEVDWSGLQAPVLLQSRHFADVRFGGYVPGWSRMVGELRTPMGVTSATLSLDDASGAAHLNVRLEKVGEDEFTAAAGSPNDPRWDLPAASISGPKQDMRQGNRFIVVLDPGHGGIDPGAEAEGLDEKSLMLTFARELSDLLLRSGEFDVILTRDSDQFVSLEQRIAKAHQAGADVFLSLHADSLAEGQAHGATVHVLSRDASDVASAKLAERHDRAQLLSGVDLSETDDQVTGVLLDLARQETQPRSELLARALVDAIGEAGGPLNRRPLRSAGFSVLKAADIPSVLVEIGFMSSARDLANLRSPTWRDGMARAILKGLNAWRNADAAMRPLVRQ